MWNELTRISDTASPAYPQLEKLIDLLPTTPSNDSADTTIDKSTSNATSMDVDSAAPATGDKPAAAVPGKEKRPAWAGKSAAEPLPEADVYVRLLVIVGLMDAKHVDEVSLRSASLVDGHWAELR